MTPRRCLVSFEAKEERRAEREEEAAFRKGGWRPEVLPCEQKQYPVPGKQDGRCSTGKTVPLLAIALTMGVVGCEKRAKERSADESAAAAARSAGAGDQPEAPRQKPKTRFQRLCDIVRRTEEGAEEGGITPEERQVLVDALSSRDHDGRRMAAIGIGNLRIRSAVPKLLFLLSEKKEGRMVRAEAARALGRIGEMQALPCLLEALKDDRVSLRLRSAEAIRLLSPSTQDTRPFATAEMFAGLLEALERVKLPKSVDEWLRVLDRDRQGTGFACMHLETVCTGVNLVRPQPLTEEGRNRAAEIARKILDSGIPPSFFRHAEELARFLRTYQPELFSQRMKEKP